MKFLQRAGLLLAANIGFVFSAHAAATITPDESKKPAPIPCTLMLENKTYSCADISIVGPGIFKVQDPRDATNRIGVHLAGIVLPRYQTKDPGERNAAWLLHRETLGILREAQLQKKLVVVKAEVRHKNGFDWLGDIEIDGKSLAQSLFEVHLCKLDCNDEKTQAASQTADLKNSSESKLEKQVLESVTYAQVDDEEVEADHHASWEGNPYRFFGDQHSFGPMIGNSRSEGPWRNMLVHGIFSDRPATPTCPSADELLRESDTKRSAEQDGTSGELKPGKLTNMVSVIKYRGPLHIQLGPPLSRTIEMGHDPVLPILKGPLNLLEIFPNLVVELEGMRDGFYYGTAFVDGKPLQGVLEEYLRDKNLATD